MLWLLLGCDAGSSTALPAPTHCWDLSRNGVPDRAEDTNGDGAWDALDCQGAGESLEKGSLYAVSGSAGSTSLATCDDNDDIMLTGGCAFNENCIPANFTGHPLHNDDDSQPAAWHWALNCGTVTASGFCLAVE